MKHWWCGVHQCCSNDDLRLTLTNLKSRSNGNNFENFIMPEHIALGLSVRQKQFRNTQSLIFYLALSQTSCHIMNKMAYMPIFGKTSS